MDTAGGGYKINLLRDAVEQYKDDSNKIILFTDRYISNPNFSFHSNTNFVISSVMTLCSLQTSKWLCINSKRWTLAFYLVLKNFCGQI